MRRQGGLSHLSIVVLFVLLGCSGCAEEPRSLERQSRARSVVLDPNIDLFVLMESSTDFREGDIDWLIVCLGAEDWIQRSRAAAALSSIEVHQAAAALYLAARGESDPLARGDVIRSLGRLGALGRPYLVRILRAEGRLSEDLVAALAQSHGVQPRRNRRSPTGRNYFLMSGWSWWAEEGEAMYGNLVRTPPSSGPSDE